MERKRANTVQKYQRASKELSGRKFPKSDELFQSFTQLFELRNAIMHPKPVGNIQVLMDFLKERGLTTDRRIPADGDVKSLTWLNRLTEPALAEWACLVAHGMIVTILDLVATETEALDTVADWLKDSRKFPVASR